MMPPPPTPEQLADIRQDAVFTASRVGAPGSPVRERAEATLALVDRYEFLKRVLAEVKPLIHHEVWAEIEKGGSCHQVRKDGG